MPINNMNDIRAILCDEIEKLRDNKTTAANVNAVTNATGKILSTIKLEIEYAKLANKRPTSNFIQLEDKATIEGGAPEKGS